LSYRAGLETRSKELILTFAVIKLHKEAMDKRPEWFWHLFAKCEAKAARVAEQATHGPHACGDATFIEVYAKTLPALVTKGLNTRTSEH